MGRINGSPPAARATRFESPPAPGSTSVSEPSSPRERFASKLSSLSDWWNTLSPWGKEKPSKFFSQEDMPSISPNFPCPDNAQTLRSTMWKKTPIHGSKIELAKGEFYQIGQSPSTAHSYSKPIAYALESGQGLVQIVSDKTHKHPLSRHTIVGMMSNMLDASPDSRRDGVKFDSFSSKKYILLNIEEVLPSDRPPARGCRHYKLTFKLSHGSNFEEVAIPLTQIGLPFENLVLKPDDIRHASHAIETYHEGLKLNVDRNYYGNYRVRRHPEHMHDQGPLLLSKHGHGRNATIATYMAVKKLINEGKGKDKINNAEDIKEAIKAAIEKGRAARPYFVHSLAQADALQTALEKELELFKISNLPPPLDPRKEGLLRLFVQAGMHNRLERESRGV